MARPPDVTSPPTRLKLSGWQCSYFKKIEPFEMEAIERAAWRSPDGEVGLALMNCDAVPHHVTFDLATMRGLEMAKEFRVIQVEDAPPTKISCQGNRLDVIIPSRKPLLIVIGQLKGGDPIAGAITSMFEAACPRH